MTDKQFWTIIESFGWPSSSELDRNITKKALLRKLSYVQIGHLNELYSEKVHNIMKASGKDYCYDDWSDCCAHIVGLGKEEYERNIENPSLITKRLEDGDFEESFSYLVPYPSDIAYILDSHYEDAAESLDEKLGVITGPVTSGYSDKEFSQRVIYLRNTLLLIGERQYQEAIRYYENHFEDGNSSFMWQDLGWRFPNLISDIRKYKIEA